MLKSSPTKGQVEALISEAIIQFEKDYMGRGPSEAKTYIVDDLVLIKLSDVLTPAEKNLAASADSESGRELIKRMRHSLLQKGRHLLEAIVKDLLDVGIKSLHTDLSTVTGERVIIFSLTDIPHIVKKAN
jgi:uncharacterized protein YbcI